MLKKSLVARLGALFLSLTCLAVNSQSIAAGNPVKGKELFAQCALCHTLGAGAEHTVGPSLNHLFGRAAGEAEGFSNYSDAMKAKGEADELLWHEKTIYKFLAGPARYVPGTIMAFEGLKTEKEIKDVIAYLIQFSPAYEAESEKEVPYEVASAAILPELIVDAEEATPEFTEAYMTSSADISAGGELWAKQCRHCHGNSAYPGKAPKLKPANYKPEFVFDRVTNGFKKMPAWKSVFSLEERMSIVTYIMSDKFSP